jgi:hypothetical protein
MDSFNPMNTICGLTSRALCVGLLTVSIIGGSTGCSSIVHGGKRTLNVNSTPAGATVTVVKNGTTEIVQTGTTPITLSLDPRGGYFKGQGYTLKFELAGYKTTEVQIRPELSGWYFGNIVFGGLIGMIVVDPLTGSMWNLTPDKIEQTLTAEQAAMIKNQQGFVVVLASQITAAEKASMVKIN